MQQCCNNLIIFEPSLLKKKIKTLIMRSFIAIAIVAILSLTACEKTPEGPNEEEVITTLTYTLTPDGGGTPVVLSFQDLDGDGGDAPIITGGTLAANTNYNGALELLNETETPAGDITEEIMEEDEDHQFFFQSTVSGLTIAYADQDSLGNPIGLATTITTKTPATGTLTVILRHEPDKAAAEVANGDITNAGGETDIEVTFDVEVQ